MSRQGGRRIARTPIDVAASTGAHAFLEWLDLVPTVANPCRTEAEIERAEHLVTVVEDQIEAIRQAKAGQ